MGYAYPNFYLCAFWGPCSSVFSDLGFTGYGIRAQGLGPEVCSVLGLGFRA